ncbi:glycoside hydrolase family 93 protein [Bisporella sp. PMI_857]|nr:glycoside hydrolase family 93 protein [Bisporella sp. PMI_857]
MNLKVFATFLALFGPALAANPFSTFSNVTIFVPPSNYTDPRVLYARTVELPGGVLLATWENYSPEPPLVYAPIYRSIDGGLTWKEISRVTDQVNNWGLRYQPELYRLPARVGKYAAGTILLATNSIPTDLSLTKIDVYASTDNGYTWKFVSHVASGGAAIPNNGIPAIWEPFLLYHNGKIILYFSDQRDPLYGQKLLHTTSKDLKTWDPTVDDVHYPTYTDRPGMTTVTRLPNGKFLMTYEYGGGPHSGTNYAFPVFYRINSNPEDFLNSPGLPLIPTGGKQPEGSPYVTWSPIGGVNGTIIVSCGTRSEIFVNQALGDVNAWKTVATPEGVSYTRHLRVLNSNPNHLLIMGAGKLPPSTTNRVTVSVIDIAKGLLTAT